MTKPLLSRLTSKGQATIPVEVRRALRLQAGDRVAFDLKNGKVTLKRRRHPRCGIPEIGRDRLRRMEQPGGRGGVPCTYKRWDVVTIDFPFVEATGSKRRPGLIVSSERLRSEYGVYWIAMITTAASGPLPSDIPGHQSRTRRVAERLLSSGSDASPP
ncbi:MAG: AbrB/MazE/SpoVT family DNA-binding domain-containing protein [Rhizomicrobium sp.]